MKIGNSSDAAAQALERAGSAAQQKASQNPQASTASSSASANAAAAAPEAGVQVDLSSAAAKLLEGGGDDGSFDAAKVDRITQAISEGRFTVNAEAVADKLVANSTEVLDRQQPSH